jgi:hypothetical protein
MRDRNARGASVPVITDAERAAVETCLGFDTQSLSAWARVLVEHVFSRAEDRRGPILAHALTVYPYVRDVSVDRFHELSLSVDVMHRCVRQHGNALWDLMQSARREQWDVGVFANRFLALLASVSESERIVLAGLLFLKTPFVPYAMSSCPHAHGSRDESARISAADIAARAPELRGRVIELRRILEHFSCAASPEGAMREFLAKFGRIEDPDIRAMILAHLFQQQARSSGPLELRIAIPVAFLERLQALAGSAPAAADRGGEQSPFSEVDIDKLLQNPKAKA